MIEETEMIEEGHGRLDVSCEHGSRWIWWPGPDNKGKWECVVWASNCGCGEPPRPFKKKKEVKG
jgi:hypothetical protein